MGKTCLKTIHREQDGGGADGGVHLPHRYIRNTPDRSAFRTPAKSRQEYLTT